MRGNWRTRLGYWLERFPWLHRWLFVYETTTAKGDLFVNRINGHAWLNLREGRR